MPRKDAGFSLRSFEKGNCKTAQAIAEIAQRRSTGIVYRSAVVTGQLTDRRIDVTYERAKACGKDLSSLYRLRSKDVFKSKNADVRELYSVGMGVHHAGMLRSDRT